MLACVAESGMMTRDGAREELGGRDGQNRFSDKNSVVSHHRMRWPGVLPRLFPKPSVRFIADVLHYVGHTCDSKERGRRSSR